MLKYFNGAQLLLVEDEPINQEIIQELLEELGVRVDTADNGEIAVQLAIKKNYNLVLMDMQMPVMDGLEATRQIRTIFRNKDVPIIAVTANVSDEDLDRYSRAGVNDFIGKPFAPNALLELILKWLSKCNF